jgi:sugar phosphate isomerase/epimerase
MKNLRLEYWVHWLASGFMLNDTKEFEKFLALCKKNGVSGVELPWKPLMGITPLQIAVSLKKFGITKMALCIFFGDIDPLGRGRNAALKHIEEAMQFIRAVRTCGIEVVCIDGPFAYQIGKKYKHREAAHPRIVSFLKEVAKMGELYEILCCIESLREDENQAIGDGLTTIRVVEWVGSPWVKAHLDTFHMDLWNENIVETLARADGNLGWFHVSGRNRHTPGSKGDEIDWKTVAEALFRNRAMNETPITCVCFEVFGPAFRAGVPKIGAGFPKDLPPRIAIPLARRTLQAAKIIAA